MTVTVRLTVRKDRPYTKTPHFRTSAVKAESGEEYYCTTGVGPDMKDATRSAVRNMIEFLWEAHKIERVAGYMLCSVAGDLRLHEVVSGCMPNTFGTIIMLFARWICRITSYIVLLLSFIHVLMGYLQVGMMLPKSVLPA